MKWFGPDWDAPVTEEGEHVETPVGEPCGSCDELIEEGDQGLVLAYYDRNHEIECWFPVHLACLIKSTTGVTLELP